MHPTASQAPLTVTRQTTPARFTASTAAEIKRGTIFLTAAKPADAPDVACTRISVALPRGDQAADLVNDEERGDFTLIDDYPRDSTGAAWSIRRIPAAPVAAAPEWGETPDHGFHNIFNPDDEHYYQTRGRVPIDTALVVDYGTAQDVDTIDIATGRPDGRNKVQMLRLQSSMDGTFWSDLDEHPVQDTSQIDRSFDPPLRARYLRINTIVEPSSENWAIVRRFLINHGARRRSEDATVTFVCTPDDGPAVFDDSREFTLILSNIPVNQVPGSAALTVTETVIGAGGAEEDHTSVLSGFDKAGTDFVFENFSGARPRVGNGEHVTLHWTGSPDNSTYYLSWGDGRTERLSVPAAAACSLDTRDLPDFGGLTRTTTFVLDAQTANSAGQTVHHYLSTTVTVADPDIAAKRVTAAVELAVGDEAADTFRARSADTATWARTAVFRADVTVT